MEPKTRLKQISVQAEALRRKAIDSPDKFTEADAEEAASIATEYASLNTFLERQQATTDALIKAGAGSVATQSTKLDDRTGTLDLVSESWGQKFMGRGGVPLSQGEKTKAYTEHILKAFPARRPRHRRTRRCQSPGAVREHHR